jgi:hypothetical protein
MPRFQDPRAFVEGHVDALLPHDGAKLRRAFDPALERF